MINPNLETILIAGVLIMCFLVALQMKRYNDAPWKSVFVAISIVITGLLSCDIWFALENGYWGGKSFYGALFFAPLTFVVVAKLLRIPYSHAMDYCATAGCLVLGLLKADCMLNGCCKGIILWEAYPGEYVRFPSQALEMLCALALMFVSIWTSRKESCRGRIYPNIMVAYGASRFVLNLFRDDWDRAHDMGIIMPIGNIWAIGAIGIGIIWIFLLKWIDSRNRI